MSNELPYCIGHADVSLHDVLAFIVGLSRGMITILVEIFFPILMFAIF